MTEKDEGPALGHDWETARNKSAGWRWRYLYKNRGPELTSWHISTERLPLDSGYRQYRYFEEQELAPVAVAAVHPDTARADKAEAERDAANARIERLIDRLNAECAAHDRTEAALAAMRKGLERVEYEFGGVMRGSEAGELVRTLLSPTAGEEGGS